MLLRTFQRRRWRAPAWSLNQLGMLSERARISDLRHRWDIAIDAFSKWVGGRIHTIYVVPVAFRAKAARLIRLGEARQRARARARKSA